MFQSQPEDFDLVISDMTMPHMTGDRLAQQILAIRMDIPVIICTGYSEKLDKEVACLAGIYKCIDKPLNKEEISGIIRDVLDRSD